MIQVKKEVTMYVDALTAGRAFVDANDSDQGYFLAEVHQAITELGDQKWCRQVDWTARRTYGHIGHDRCCELAAYLKVLAEQLEKAGE